MTIEITDLNSEKVITNSNTFMVIDFWADHCGPCKLIGPILNEIAMKYQNEIVIGKVDVSVNPNLTMKYGIRNIPTLVFIKNGEVVHKHIGMTTKVAIENKLNYYR